jgi:DNA-binding helix-hairpin-helix protein with protein kinase domain
MSELLKPKQIVQIGTTGTCEVVRLLGAGGQGEVYEAKLGGKLCALKWYYDHTATTEQKKALEDLIRKGAPSDRFLWPLDLAVSEGQPNFGYIMPLREDRYKSIVDLMKRRIDPSFRTLMTVGRELVSNFLYLHSKGLSYGDISFGNVFFDPSNGEVLICDNDNVVINGSASSGGVVGTLRFMAPEIVRGESLPNTDTDLFSLSVLLFYIFLIHHPLEGKKEAAIHALDLPAMTKLYGTDPLFIFDPSDISNRPEKGYHDNALAYWPIYPNFLQKLFIEAFTVGLHSSQKRVRESIWRSAMEKMSDIIFYCSNCGRENFHDSEDAGKPCWECGKIPTKPLCLKLGNLLIMLNHDTQLFPHHVDQGRAHDFSKVVAAVQRHPNNPSIWGLKNLSPQTWSCTTANGAVSDIEPGRSATLALGTIIHFGNIDARIEWI